MRNALIDRFVLKTFIQTGVGHTRHWLIVRVLGRHCTAGHEGFIVLARPVSRQSNQRGGP